MRKIIAVLALLAVFLPALASDPPPMWTPRRTQGVDVQHKLRLPPCNDTWQHERGDICRDQTTGEIMWWDGNAWQATGGGEGGSGDMRKSTYDTNDNGIVDNAEDLTCTSCVDIDTETTGTLSAGRGGTGNTTAPLNAVLIGNDATWQRFVMPSCSDESQALGFDVAANEFVCLTDDQGSGGGGGSSGPTQDDHMLVGNGTGSDEILLYQCTTDEKLRYLTSTNEWTCIADQTGDDAADDLSDNVLNDLSNVDANPSNGQVLAWNGSQWTATNDSTGNDSQDDLSDNVLSDLSDVSTTSPSSGQVLKWDGTQWAPGTDNTSSGSGSDYALSLDLDQDGVNPYVSHAVDDTDFVKLDPSSDSDNGEIKVKEHSDKSMDIWMPNDNWLSIISDGSILFRKDNDEDAGGPGGTTTTYRFEGLANCAVETDADGDLVCGTDDTGNDTEDDLSDNVLSDLSDVSSTAPTSGQVLKWDGSAWAPAADETGSGGSSDYAIALDLDKDGTNPYIQDASNEVRIDPDSDGNIDVTIAAATGDDGEISANGNLSLTADADNAGGGSVILTGYNSCTALETDASGAVQCGTDDTGNDSADDLSDNALDDLGDVSASAPTDGQCLKWIAASSEWQAGDCGSGGSSGPTADNNMWIGDGTTTLDVPIPDCASSNQKLIYHSSTHSWTCEADATSTGGGSDWALGLDSNQDGTNPYLHRSGTTVLVDADEDGNEDVRITTGYVTGSGLISARAGQKLYVEADDGVVLDGDADESGAGSITFSGMNNCTLKTDANGAVQCGTDETGNDSDDDLSNNVLSDLSDVSTTAPASGQVLKWNGSAWAPATDETGSGGGGTATAIDSDSDGTYEVFVSSGTIRMNPDDDGDGTNADIDYYFGATSCSAHEVLSTASGNEIGCNPLKDVSNSSNGIGVKDLNNVDDSISPSDGQVLKWNATNSQWEAADDDTGSGGSTDTTTPGQVINWINEDFLRWHVTGTNPYHLNDPYEWRIGSETMPGNTVDVSPVRYNSSEYFDTVKLSMAADGDGEFDNNGLYMVAESYDNSNSSSYDTTKTTMFALTGVHHVDLSATIRFSTTGGYKAIGLSTHMSNSDSTAAGTNFYHAMFEFTGTGNWHGTLYLLGMSSECNVDLGVAPGTVNRTFRIVIDRDAGTTEFYIDGSLKGTCSGISGSNWSTSGLEFGVEWRSDDETVPDGTLRIDQFTYQFQAQRAGRY